MIFVKTNLKSVLRNCSPNFASQTQTLKPLKWTPPLKQIMLHFLSHRIYPKVFLSLNWIVRLVARLLSGINQLPVSSNPQQFHCWRLNDILLSLPSELKVNFLFLGCANGSMLANICRCSRPFKLVFFGTQRHMRVCAHSKDKHTTYALIKAHINMQLALLNTHTFSFSHTHAHRKRTHLLGTNKMDACPLGVLANEYCWQNN